MLKASIGWTIYWLGSNGFQKYHFQKKHQYWNTFKWNAAYSTFSFYLILPLFIYLFIFKWRKIIFFKNWWKHVIRVPKIIFSPDSLSNFEHKFWSEDKSLMFSLAYSIHLQPTDLEKSFQGRKKSKWCHKIVHLFTLCCEKLLCFVHVFFLILWFQVDNIWGELHARGTCTWFFFFFSFFFYLKKKQNKHTQINRL